jgi:hypothetical protein
VSPWRQAPTAGGATMQCCTWRGPRRAHPTPTIEPRGHRRAIRHHQTASPSAHERRSSATTSRLNVAGACRKRPRAPVASTHVPPVTASARAAIRSSPDGVQVYPNGRAGGALSRQVDGRGRAGTAPSAVCPALCTSARALLVAAEQPMGERPIRSGPPGKARGERCGHALRPGEAGTPERTAERPGGRPIRVEHG